jgi:chromosomal replication initiator protein
MTTLAALLTDRPARPSREAPGSAAPDPWDGYLQGAENALARDAALALLRGQREGLSPLLIHGPSGAGKTRLLDALALEWHQRHPAIPAQLLDAETFAAACAAAGRRAADWSALRDRFRNCGLFLLDNLPALARSPLAIDELTFTLDDLEAAGAAIAVACTWPPGQWTPDLLPRRLASRLSCGLAVRLDLPGSDLRRRYLLDHARQKRLRLGSEAIDWILTEVPGGFPQLEGTLVRLALEARLRPRAALPTLDLAFVRQVLTQATAESAPPSPTSLADTVRAVAATFRVSLRDLRSASRHSSLVEVRHLAMFLAREQTTASFAAIGAYFGGRDPATVRHACRAAATRLQARPDLEAALHKLRSPQR